MIFFLFFFFRCLSFPTIKGKTWQEASYLPCSSVRVCVCVSMRLVDPLVIQCPKVNNYPHTISSLRTDDSTCCHHSKLLRISWDPERDGVFLQFLHGPFAYFHHSKVEKGRNQRLPCLVLQNDGLHRVFWLNFGAKHIFASYWFQTSVRDKTHYLESLSANPLSEPPGLGFLFIIWGNTCTTIFATKHFEDSGVLTHSLPPSPILIVFSCNEPL